MVPFIWFTDEKLFTVSAPLNSQNNRLYARSGVHKRNLPAERVLHTRATFFKSIMVSVGVSAMGSTDLIFVEPGTKINRAYYRDVLLSQHLLPAIKQYGDFSFFGRTAHHHTAPRKPSNCCPEKHLTLSSLLSGLQIVQISTQWTIRSGVCCRIVYTKHA